jgi:hypothetical protein
MNFPGFLHLHLFMCKHIYIDKPFKSLKLTLARGYLINQSTAGGPKIGQSMFSLHVNKC